MLVLGGADSRSVPVYGGQRWSVSIQLTALAVQFCASVQVSAPSSGTVHPEYAIDGGSVRSRLVLPLLCLADVPWRRPTTIRKKKKTVPG